MRASAAKCANPECKIEFKRLGMGKLYILAVADSKSWGLPENVKQKVAWLCSKCAAGYEVEFDEQQCQVRLVERAHLPQRRTA
jgi:hypothetical protein